MPTLRNQHQLGNRRHPARTALFLIGSTLALVSSSAALADSRVYAYRLFNRINGVPPSAETLDQLTRLINDGKYEEAGRAAINDPSGNFYTITLANVFGRWSNVKQTPRQELNDLVATAIGLVKDEKPFGQFLYEDIVYVPTAGGYALNNNDAYRNLQTSGANLATSLRASTQRQVGIPGDAIAGVFSLRGFAEAYYSAGTNRRAVAFAMSNFLCRPMETLKDPSRPDDRVRQDVTRAPGGDASKFRNECAGCHAGMDGLGGAFAYYDFPEDRLQYSPTQEVNNKFLRNASEFPDGYVTTDASWVNKWTEGVNADMGWGSPSKDVGAQSLGRMIASTKAFSTCMAQTAVETMCGRKIDPNVTTAAADKAAVAAIATDFTTSQNMKNAFLRAAIYCAK